MGGARDYVDPKCDGDESARYDVVFDILTAAAVCLVIVLGMLHVFYIYETIARIRVAILVLGVCSSCMLFGVLACLCILRRKQRLQPTDPEL